MKNFAENVVVFNSEILKNPRGKKQLETIPQSEWLVKALTEEIQEYQEAHSKNDYVGAIDALIDLMYFAVGGLHRMGLTPDEMGVCGCIIHKANMNKKLGVVDRRGDGTVPDAIKPMAFESPEDVIAYFLEVKREK